MESEEFELVINEIIDGIMLRKKIGKEKISKYLEANERLIKKIEREGLYKRLLERERYLLDNLINKLYYYNLHLEILSNQMNKELIIKNYKLTGKKVSIGIVIKEIPYKFRGTNGRIYGPYKVGDIILINIDDYKLLRDSGYIKEVIIER